MIRNGTFSHKIEFFLGVSKSQRTSNSYYWFKSYGDFAEWEDKVVKLVGGGSVINGRSQSSFFSREIARFFCVLRGCIIFFVLRGCVSR